ncbi:hypothetical protein V5O48_012975 [Marasmius crinis-equi]|uniref:F-box domain-containing protein n=1 Tax=Marasmius crinis-equi TaxID=585013 RepID=A0ABR3F1D6_9AGAR
MEPLESKNPFILNLFWLNGDQIVLARDVCPDDTLLDVFGKRGLEMQPGNMASKVYTAAAPGRLFRAFLPNQPIPVAESCSREAITEKLGDLEASCREWHRQTKIETYGEQLFEIPLFLSASGSLPLVGKVIQDVEGNDLLAEDNGGSQYGSDSESEDSLRLPPELLWDIFRRNITIAELVNPSVLATSKAQMMSLLPVCKAWHDVAAEVLYEDVYIRDLPQLAKFCDMLAMSTRGYHTLVKKLTIEALIPKPSPPPPPPTSTRRSRARGRSRRDSLPSTPDYHALVATVLINTLSQVFRLCTDVVRPSITLTADDNNDPFLPFLEERLGLPMSSLLSASTRALPDLVHHLNRLRELHLGHEAFVLLFPNHFSKHYAQSQALEVLELSVSSELWGVVSDTRLRDAISDTEWSYIKWFRCSFHECRSEVQGAVIRAYAEHLTMPCLQRLSISGHLLREYHPDVPAKVENAFPLIEAHKSRLEYLSVVGFTRRAR